MSGVRRAAIGVAAAITALSPAVALAQEESPPDSSSASTDPVATEPTTTTTAPPTTTSTTTASTAAPTTTTTAPATTTTTTTVAVAADEPMIESATLAAAAVVTPPGCAGSRILLGGYQGLDVGCLDNQLATLGYLATPNNVMDAATAAALAAFQTANGLYPSGIAGPATLRALAVWAVPANAGAVPAGAFGCVLSRILLSGYAGIDVRCLDNVLMMLGYPLAANDVYDAATLAAVRQLQADLGLGGDGSSGPITLTAIGLWTSPPPGAGGPPAGSYGCALSRILLAGYGGIDVQCLDNVLKMLGYRLTPNNVVDDETMAALRSVQSAHGLSPSGIAGPATLRRLSLWTLPVNPWSPPAGSFGCTTSRTLAPAASGMDAQCLDNVLVALGYVLAPNNVVDASTVDAVARFQGDVGLPADGVAGPTTLTRLGLYVAPPDFGLPGGSGSGRRVVYSRGQQRVWVVDGNGNVIKTHRVSGRLYEPYKGTYSVYSRSMYTYSVDNPDIKWRYMVRFAYGPGGGRIGFHEIPTKFGVPLQSVAQLGQPLSGGCVRQSTADAQWMWNWAGIGTKVVVL